MILINDISQKLVIWIVTIEGKKEEEVSTIYIMGVTKTVDYQENMG